MFTNPKFRIGSAALAATAAAAVAAGVATASAAPGPARRPTAPHSFAFVHHYDKATPILK